MNTTVEEPVTLHISIQDMSPLYEDQVWVLAQEMWQESVSHNDMQLDREKLMQQLRASQQNPNVYFKLAIRGGEVLGGFFGLISKVYFSEELAARDMAWFVKKSSRGSYAAVMLVHDWERWGKGRGVSKFFLGQSTGVNVEVTRRLYEKMGYRVVGFNTVKEC